MIGSYSLNSASVGLKFPDDAKIEETFKRQVIIKKVSDFINKDWATKFFPNFNTETLKKLTQEQLDSLVPDIEKIEEYKTIEDQLTKNIQSIDSNSIEVMSIITTGQNTLENLKNSINATTDQNEKDQLQTLTTQWQDSNRNHWKVIKTNNNNKSEQQIQWRQQQENIKTESTNLHNKIVSLTSP